MTNLPYPILTNKLSSLSTNLQNKIPHWIQETYPIADSSVFKLIEKFIRLKQTDGTQIEQDFYKGFQVEDMVNRLLQKRPLVFIGSRDQYLLLNGKQGGDGRLQFDQIGTHKEEFPFTLEHLISYDEMRLAALLGIATATPFINQGGRRNHGIPTPSSQHIEEGIYTGLVGARFERPERMEYSHILITPEQNSVANGYGVNRIHGSKEKHLALWAKFYNIGSHFPSFSEAMADYLARGKESNYLQISANVYLNTKVYKQRIKVVLRPFLLDAENRGKRGQQFVFIYAVGLGLGVWAVENKIQGILYAAALLEILAENSTPHISDIDFSWFPAEVSSTYPKQVEGKSGNIIKLHYTADEGPATLTSAKSDKLLVAMYAWDGNAYPGNEYWIGQLNTSGDPAAAACSCIAELGNPLVHPSLNGTTIQWKISGGESPPLTDPASIRNVNMSRVRIVFSDGVEHKLRGYQKEAFEDWQKDGSKWMDMIYVNPKGVFYMAHGDIGQFYIV